MYNVDIMPLFGKYMKSLETHLKEENMKGKIKLNDPTKRLFVSKEGYVIDSLVKKIVFKVEDSRVVYSDLPPSYFYNRLTEEVQKEEYDGQEKDLEDSFKETESFYSEMSTHKPAESDYRVTLNVDEKIDPLAKEIESLAFLNRTPEQVAVDDLISLLSSTPTIEVERPYQGQSFEELAKNLKRIQ